MGSCVAGGTKWAHGDRFKRVKRRGKRGITGERAGGWGGWRLDNGDWGARFLELFLFGMVLDNWEAGSSKLGSLLYDRMR